MTDSKSRSRRILLIVLASVAAAAIAVTPFVGPLAAVFGGGDSDTAEPTTPTSVAPVLTSSSTHARPL